MPSIESTGKTIEDALEGALQQLQVPPERVEVEVLQEPGHGVLGIGGAEAKIRVTVLKEHALVAERFLVEILELMGIEASVEHRLDGREEGPAIIDIRGADLGALIGWRGDTLRALQLLLNNMVRREMPEAEPVVLDIERYRARREDSVRELAIRVADRAKQNQERIGLEPMQPFERRAVHTALADDPGITTESEGEEPDRRVVISPLNPRRQEVVNYGNRRTMEGDRGRPGFGGGGGRGGLRGGDRGDRGGFGGGQGRR
ncbi:MAG TPA: RNA-binding cell elongation regulator Jag/EloR [Candidatus Dormibacteraeota bacterium]|nr:RNA-binding cell elongation regulator Jag/EloR [Candidatus Dormibacteraeota bacterium]